MQVEYIRLQAAYHQKMGQGWTELLPKIEGINVQDTRRVSGAGVRSTAGEAAAAATEGSSGSTSSSSSSSNHDRGRNDDEDAVGI